MKQIANLYSFDPTARRVTIQGLSIPQARLLLIVNARLGQILYDGQSLGATDYQNVSGNTVVTLASDTSAQSSIDFLTIYYEDGQSAVEGMALSDLNTVGGSDPAPWLKKGGGNVPVEILSGGSAGSGGAASVSLSEVTGTAALSSTQVLAANTSRKYLLLQNLSAAAIYISFGSVVSTSTLRLDGGASLCFEGTAVPTNALRLLGTQAGQNYYIAHA
jgi:hypothetical protein